MLKNTINRILIVGLLIFSCVVLGGKVYACDQSTSTFQSITDNGDGTFDLTFEVCFAGDQPNQGDSHGFYITLTGANIISVDNTSYTISSTVNSSISGSTVEYGPWNDDSSACFVCTDDPQQCINVTVTADARPTDWEVGGQEYSQGPPGPTSWCSYSGPVPMSAEVLSLKLEKQDDCIMVIWEASNEVNNEFFTVERSTDLNSWETVSTLDGAGDSPDKTSYNYKDSYAPEGTVYYRVKDTDVYGRSSYSGIKAIYNDGDNASIVKTVNLFGQPVDENYKGFVINIYSDGTSVKSFR